MTYSADIDALGPDHRWAFNGNVNDSFGTANATNSGAVLTGTALCEDVANSVRIDGRTDRVTVPSVATTTTSAHTVRTIGGWFMVDAIQTPPCRIYGEGSQTNGLQIVLGYGNNVIFEFITSGTAYQVYTDRVLAPGRAYHLALQFSGAGSDDDFKAWLDGERLQVSNPASTSHGLGSFQTGGAAEFGDPAGTSGIGASSLLLVAPVNAHFNQWASWTGASAELTDTQIASELVAKGSIPRWTITAGTVAAMQAQLDALVAGLGGSLNLDNRPLDIRVEQSTDFVGASLFVDGLSFSPLTTNHIHYTGGGVCEIVNRSGGNASRGIATGGGSVRFVNYRSVSVTARDAATQAPVQNARLRLLTGAGGPAASDEVVLEGVTDASGVISTSLFPYLGSDQPVNGVLRKGDPGDSYRGTAVRGTVTEAGLSLTVLLVPDA